MKTAILMSMDKTKLNLKSHQKDYEIREPKITN